MKLSDFDFDLPPRLIAQTPADKRDQSRLMIVDRDRGEIRHDQFRNLPDHLQDSPLMVFNNTRVLPARLRGVSSAGGRIRDVLLVRETAPNEWTALMRGMGKMKIGEILDFGGGRAKAELVGFREENHKKEAVLRFTCEGRLLDHLQSLGEMPLPPYIRRDGEASGSLTAMDKERYQTVYAGEPGAIAAPTAGLHFTGDMLSQIRRNHAESVFLTLHVGAGTFTPVRHEDLSRHKMDAEFYRIPADTWNSIHTAKKGNRPILAVGTTSTRVLESLDFAAPALGEHSGWTEIFIHPGADGGKRNFRNVTRLLTNFHLPKSTLYLLVCAFAGRELMRKAYSAAIAEKYRFFSYGDAMLIV